MHDLRAISALFDMRADFVDAQSFGSGHINDTYCASYDQAGVARPLHPPADQPPRLQESGPADGKRRPRDPLTRWRDCSPKAIRKPIAARSPAFPRWTASPTPSMRRATSGASIRSSSVPAATTKSRRNEQAYQAARAFGEFQKLAADLSAASGCTKRFPISTTRRNACEALEAAIASDLAGRAADRAGRRSPSPAPAPRIARASPTSSPPEKSPSASPTTTPSSTTCCSTKPPPKASA